MMLIVGKNDKINRNAHAYFTCIFVWFISVKQALS